MQIMKWAVALFHICGVVCVHAQVLVTYPIDFTQVPSTQPSPLVAGNNDIGTCTCDLTVSACDDNCVCDADCSAAEVARFSGSLPQGPQPSQVFVCVDPNFVQSNARGEITSTIVDNMLCVYKNNNPSKGSFFPTPGAVTSSSYTTTAALYPYSYNPSFATQPARSDGNYDVDDTITGAVSLLGTLTATASGFLTFPARGFTSECSDRNFPRYRRDYSHSCLRSTSNLPSTCTSAYDANQYVTNVYAGILRSAVPSISSQYVSITLSSLIYRTIAGDTVLATSSLPVPTYNAGTSTCDNALISLAYTFNYDPAGTVTAVSARVVIGPVTASAAGFVSVPQTYAASWNVSQSARPRSGNPGYVVGLPVLAGTLSTSGSLTAVSQFAAGLTVLSHNPSTFLCAVPNLAGHTRYNVTFGEDGSFGCFVSLTLANLQTLCAAGNTLPYFNLLATHVGSFGNASNLLTRDWVQMSTNSLTESPVFTASTQSCSGIITSLTLRVLTADVGAFNNPQREILGVSVNYATSTWQFIGRNSGTAQRFPLVATVQFLNVPPPALNYFTPSPPPVLPALPNDVLYPLYLASSASSVRPPSTLLSFLSLCTLWAVGYLAFP